MCFVASVMHASSFRNEPVKVKQGFPVLSCVYDEFTETLAREVNKSQGLYLYQ